MEMQANAFAIAPFSFSGSAPGVEVGQFRRPDETDRPNRFGLYATVLRHVGRSVLAQENADIRDMISFSTAVISAIIVTLASDRRPFGPLSERGHVSRLLIGVMRDIERQWGFDADHIEEMVRPPERIRRSIF